MATNVFDSFFDQRALNAPVDLRKTPQRGFTNLFFNESPATNAEYIEIEVKDGVKRLAPAVFRGGVAIPMEEIATNKYVYKPPYYKIKRNFTPSDLRKAALGANPYDLSSSSGMALAAHIGNAVLDMDDCVQRVIEKMAVDSVQSRQITVLDQDGNTFGEVITAPVDVNYDFNAVNAWSDFTAANPIADLTTARRKIAQKTGLGGQCIAIMGSTSASEFVQSLKVQARINIQIGSVGAFVARATALGLIYIGTFDGIECYEFAEYYKSPSTGAETALIGAEKVIVGVPNQYSLIHYAGLDLFDPTVGAKYVRSIMPRESSNEVYAVEYHSSPLPYPHVTHSFCVIST